MLKARREMHLALPMRLKVSDNEEESVALHDFLIHSTVDAREGREAPAHRHPA